MRGLQNNTMSKDKAKIYAHIGKFTRAYDLTLKLSGYQSSVGQFIKNIPIPVGRAIEVLDAGCGTGLYTMAVLKRYPKARVTAFDLNPKFVAALKRKVAKKRWGGRATMFAADLTGPLPEIAGHKFDLIITSGVLEHVKLEKTAKRLSDYLTPEGYFLNSPVRDIPLGRGVTKFYNCKPYPRQRNIEAFTGIGFNLEKTVVLPEILPASFK